MKRKALNTIESVLKRHQEVAFAYLYGSFVMDPENASDIDVAVGLKGVEDLLTALQITGDIREELDGHLDLPPDIRTRGSFADSEQKWV